MNQNFDPNRDKQTEPTKHDVDLNTSGPSFQVSLDSPTMAGIVPQRPNATTDTLPLPTPLPSIPYSERPTDAGIESPTKVSSGDKTVSLPSATSTAPVVAEASGPSFFTADGSLDLVETRRLVINNRAANLPEATILPLIEWASGVQKSTSQTTEQYFAKAKSGQLSKWVHTGFAQLNESIDSGLRKIAKGISSDTLAGGGMNLRGLILKDPAGMCLRMIRVIENDGNASRDLASALVAFHKVANKLN